MKLFLIEPCGELYEFDRYIAAVVVARDEDAARRMHPDGLTPWNRRTAGTPKWSGEWSKPKDVVVTYLGEADPSVKPGVVLDSFLGA